jgi:hypothetical protein
MLPKICQLRVLYIQKIVDLNSFGYRASVDADQLLFIPDHLLIILQRRKVQVLQVPAQEA